MANRFRGDASGSARQYREIVNELFAAIDVTKNVTAEVAVDADEQLCSRLINSLERLGDCNLFAPPESRNLHEAFDDYRRAHTVIHRLPARASDTGDPASLQAADSRSHCGTNRARATEIWPTWISRFNRPERQIVAALHWKGGLRVC